MATEILVNASFPKGVVLLDIKSDGTWSSDDPKAVLTAGEGTTTPDTPYGFELDSPEGPQLTLVGLILAISKKGDGNSAQILPAGDIGTYEVIQTTAAETEHGFSLLSNHKAKLKKKRAR